MNKIEKKDTKIEFLKNLMLHSSDKSCDFCKYHWANYKYKSNEIQSMALDHFAEVCKDCIYSYHYKKFTSEQKKERCWFSNKFKPLYDWDDEEGEGENNG